MNDSPVNESPETDSLRKDLDQLRKDFSALSDDVKHTSRDQVRAGMDKAKNSFGFVTDEIESRPLTCTVAALGVGLLLGKMLSR